MRQRHNRSSYRIIRALRFGLLLCLPLHAWAQEEATSPEAEVKGPPEIPLQSLFYSESEVNKIHETISVFLQRQQGRKVDIGFLGEEEYLDKATQLKQLQGQGRFYTYPQFFLESLVFHSDTDWSIWINGQKISAGSTNDSHRLTVQEIDKDKVSLEWFPRDMDQVIKTAKKWPNENIVIDDLNGSVFFTLRPNQTFSSYVLRVLEGKVKPVTVDAQSIANSLQLPVGAAPTGQEEPAILPDNGQGMIELFDNPQ